MNALTGWNHLRWNQLNRLEYLQHTLQSLFNRSGVRWPAQDRRAPQWIPLVDVRAEIQGYVVRVELPQVKKQDVNIAIEDGKLTITGDRNFDRNSKKDHPIVHAYGRFSHSFELPADARPAKVSAKFKDGVLIVHLARKVIKRRRVEGKGSLAGIA
jgi:HSP20 family protein